MTSARRQPPRPQALSIRPAWGHRYGEPDSGPDQREWSSMLSVRDARLRWAMARRALASAGPALLLVRRDASHGHARPRHVDEAGRGNPTETTVFRELSLACHSRRYF